MCVKQCLSVSMCRKAIDLLVEISQNSPINPHFICTFILGLAHLNIQYANVFAERFTIIGFASKPQPILFHPFTSLSNVALVAPLLFSRMIGTRLTVEKLALVSNKHLFSVK